MLLNLPFIKKIPYAQPGYQLSVSQNDRYRRYVTSFVCSFISIIFFMLMAVINISQQYYTVAIMLVICSVICAACLAMQISSHNYHLPSLLLCSTHIILSWFLFTLGSNSMWSIMWTFVYPYAFMLWLGLVEGAAMSVFFIVSMCLLSLPPVQKVLPNRYEWETIVRYLFVLTSSFSLAIFMEFIRSRVQKKLTLLTRQAKNMAFTDPLTGLGNRLAFEQHLTSEYARLTRTNGKFCIIMCDIDAFKVINDIKGHAAGDAVLQHTAEILQGRMRRQDGVYRWGGEEFVITLLGLELKDVARIAEELSHAISSTPCPYQNEKISYTMSFGVYCCNKNETPEQAMQSVDELLYAAKSAGRNRVMTDATHC